VSLSSVDGPGDAELIAAVRGGDVDAYGELFARHVDAARRLARQLAGPGDSDDLVSDAFAKVLTVLQRGGGPDLAFRAYLLTAVRRLHVDRIRSGSRLRPVDDLAPFDPGVPFHDTAIEGFDNATAAKAFASLPERWQMVLWHTEVEQQKPADIAVLLGMSANSVSALAYRAREGLRQAFLSMHAADPDDVDCAWTRDHLGAYVRGGLSRRDAARVDDHIADCRSCAAVYLELTEVNSGLAALLAPLLLGAAGVGYLSSAGGSAVGAAGAAGATGFAAAKGWVAAHASLSAAGGVALTATAVVAVYAAAQLGGHGASPEGSPAGLDRAIASSTSPATAGTGPGRDGGTRVVDPNDRTSQAGDPTGTTSTTVPTGSPTSSSTSNDSAPPTDGASSGPTDGPPPTDPTDGPTDPTTGPTDPTTGPTDPPPPPPITFDSTPPADAAIGGTYRVSASGGSGNQLTFSIDPTTTNDACSIAGDLVSFNHAGTCVIAAQETSKVRAGIGARAGSVVTQTVVVPKTAQTVTFSFAPTDLSFGGTYDLVATGGGSGNPVTFSVDDATTNSACSLSGPAQVTFAHAGTCVVTATQAGDGDHTRATSTRDVVVPRAAQAITFTSNAPSTAVVGDSYQVSATGGGSGNPVEFSTTDADVCAVSGSTVSFLDAGTCTIHADQSGNPDYLDAPTATQGVKVVAPAEADLAVTAERIGEFGGLAGVRATVTGLPQGAAATLIVTADGPRDLNPIGDGERCTKVLPGNDSAYSCQVTGAGQERFWFAVNVPRGGRDLTFLVVPVAPLTDDRADNNSFGLHLGE
jgi:RNA polymerase sigma factor (sigma-70 family)